MKHQQTTQKTKSSKTAPGDKGAGSAKDKPTNSKTVEQHPRQSNSNTGHTTVMATQTAAQTLEVPAPAYEAHVSEVQNAVIEPVTGQTTVDQTSFTTKLKKQQRSYLYCSALKQLAVSELQTVFPNIKAWKNPNTEENSHQHPMLATLRANFESFLRFEMDLCLPQADMMVQDIGGNPRRNMAKASLFSHKYHSCNPILDASDERRQQERLSHLNLAAYYCNHSFIECDCVSAAGYVSVDSVYYLSDDELYKAASKPFWACFHDLRGETGAVPNGKFSEGSFVRIGNSVEMSVKGNSSPYQHRDMDWAFSGKKVGDKWIMFEEKLRYGTYVAGKFYLSKFAPSKPALQLHVKTTEVIENLAPRLMGLSPEEKLAKARRIVIAEKVPSSAAAQSIKGLVAVAEAIDRKVEISRLSKFQQWKMSIAAKWNDLQEVFAIYSYFSYKTFFLRWLSLLLIAAVVYYLETRFEDWARRWLGMYYQAPRFMGFWYWLFPSWSQSIHGFACEYGTELDAWRFYFKELAIRWDYLEILSPPEKFFIVHYCVKQVPSWSYYFKYLYYVPFGIVAFVLASMEFLSLLPIAFNVTTRVVFMPVDLVVAIGKVVRRDTKALKHGRNIDQVIGTKEYQPPIPSSSAETQHTALKQRLAQGVERVTNSITGNPWKQVEFNVWDILQVPNMSFQTWITEFYGRRDEPAMVKKYQDAYANLNELRCSKNLFVDAFVKVETYPGKLDKVKPRLVQNVTDLRQILRTSVMSAAINHEIKEFQKVEMRPILYSSGYNPLELGRWVQHWREHGFDCVLENDFSEFESRVSVEALEFEFSVYNKLIGHHKGWPQLHHELKRQLNPVISMDGAQYTREGGRCSGVPNTSLGNTILNMASTIWVLSKLDMKYGEDYVAMFLGDDSYVMTKKIVDVEVVSDCFSTLGFKAEVKFYLPTEIMSAEYCSGRFFPHEEGLCWVPKAGRILLKGISVPSDVRNVPEYIAPVMRHYATKVYCPIIQLWAQAYCRVNGITWTETPVVPAPIEALFDVYGKFDLSWLSSVTEGCWYYSLDAISPLVDVDCPIGQVDDVNHYGLPSRLRKINVISKLYHFVMKFYVPTNKVMPHDEVLGYQQDLAEF